ncbi:MAG: hypothetical protein HRU26_14260 [Psychroserpens sp.]|nr:hypothetical protein [Psychroserpens sp.]
MDRDAIVIPQNEQGELEYPPELLQFLEGNKIDPSFLAEKPNMKDIKEEVEEITDPILKRMSKLEDENLIAFRIAKEGFDTVYNIANNWTYNMVQECQVYIDSLNEYQERETKKSEHNA